jgi:hypothetical protein
VIIIADRQPAANAIAHRDGRRRWGRQGGLCPRPLRRRSSRGHRVGHARKHSSPEQARQPADPLAPPCRPPTPPAPPCRPPTPPAPPCHPPTPLAPPCRPPTPLAPPCRPPARQPRPAARQPRPAARRLWPILKTDHDKVGGKITSDAAAMPAYRGQRSRNRSRRRQRYRDIAGTRIGVHVDPKKARAATDRASTRPTSRALLSRRRRQMPLQWLAMQAADSALTRWRTDPIPAPSSAHGRGTTVWPNKRPSVLTIRPRSPSWRTRGLAPQPPNGLLATSVSRTPNGRRSVHPSRSYSDVVIDH